MKYALVGYGKMGRAIEVQAAARGHERVAVVDPAKEAEDLAAGQVGGADVAFEFTLAAAAEPNVSLLLREGVSVVCGTTGWEPTDALHATLEASPAGLVLAPNFSLGVNLFFRVVRQAARMYGTLGLHDPFIHEAHHRAKLDVPSGTARRLASIVLEAIPALRSVQEGNPAGPIEPGTLHVTSTRAGAEPGSHSVGFDGQHDAITLLHRARGREGFALGAVLAAEWVRGRAGLHSFDEVVDDILARGPNGQGGQE